MTKYRIYIDTFDSAGHLRGKKRTYETVKASILEAGRFSTFEATETAKNARLFTRLCADPEIETFDLGFPWTGVRRVDLARIDASADAKEAK
jgi:hypothetical protein